MAATRLIPLHISKSWSIKQCLNARMKYAKNPEKTRNEELVTSYACEVATASEEFLLSHRQYELHARRHYDREVIAYQIRQSFKPGEVTAEEANRIGYQTAMKFTKGKHAFIVATHTDRAHIHSHILFNAVDISETHKFKNFFLSAFVLQRISDYICLEHGLSVINPRPYRERDNIVVYPKRISAREMIRETVDRVLAKNPKSYEEFLNKLREQGYEVKTGKYTSLKGKGQKRFIRLRSLGDGYREEDIRKKLGDVAKDAEKNVEESEVTKTASDEKFNMLLDIEDIIRKGKGKGYEIWAKKYNLKNAMKALMFLQEKGVSSYEELVELTKNSAAKFDELSKRIKKDERRIREIKKLRGTIFDYSRTRDTYIRYREAGYSKKFFEENRDAILAHKAAKDAFEKLGVKKIPKVRELNEEMEKLMEDKNKVYAEYRQAKKDMQKFHTAKYDVDRILNMEERGTCKEREQEMVL